MSKFQIQKLIRSCYYLLGPNEAFELSVRIIDFLHDDGQISDELGVFALKLTQAYKEILEV